MRWNEHVLVDQLLALVRPQVERKFGGRVFKHADGYTSGIPDLSVSMAGRTTWWEVKHATPLIKGTELQRVTAGILAKASACWYVVYAGTNSRIDLTALVAPASVDPEGTFTPKDTARGLDHVFVLDCILAAHGRERWPS